MSVQISNSNLLKFNQIIGNLLSTEKYKKTKVEVFFTNLLKNRLTQFIDQYNLDLEDLELENANTDKDGSVLFVDTKFGRKYQFNKEGLKKKDKGVIELLKKTFEFEPIHCSIEEVGNLMIIEEGDNDVVKEIKEIYASFILYTPSKEIV
jgi:hypothetical protein